MTDPAMESTGATLLVFGNGILAADERFPTIEKRFKVLNIPCTEEMRRTYRERLFTTSGLDEFISGAILFDGTTGQNTNDGIPLSEVLTRQVFHSNGKLR